MLCNRHAGPGDCAGASFFDINDQRATGQATRSRTKSERPDRPSESALVQRCKASPAAIYPSPTKKAHPFSVGDQSFNAGSAYNVVPAIQRSIAGTTAISMMTCQKLADQRIRDICAGIGAVLRVEIGRRPAQCSLKC